VKNPISFSRPLKIDRPFGTHRFDMFSTKINRRLTLYGRRSLEAWVKLEYDKNVTTFCEYPITLENTSPPRHVDFWVKDSNESVFWMLLRPAEQRDLDGGGTLFLAFEQWAADRGAKVRLLTQENLNVPPLLLQNYELALHYVQPNISLVPEDMRGDVRERYNNSFSLGALERELAPADPILIRTMVFAGLVAGELECDTLAIERLGIQSVFRRRTCP
jgi:hypothetical protein